MATSREHQAAARAFDKARVLVGDVLGKTKDDVESKTIRDQLKTWAMSCRVQAADRKTRYRRRW